MNEDNQNKHSQGETEPQEGTKNFFEEGSTGHLPELNNSKLLFLGFLAFLFSSLEPFALFASIPFTLCFLLYGKPKTIAIGVIGTALAFALVQVKAYQGSALGTFPMSLIYGYLISNIVRKEVHPIKGIVINGLGMFAVIITAIAAFHYSVEGGLPKVLDSYVVKASTTYYEQWKSRADIPKMQLDQFQDVMKNPKIIVDPIMKYGFGVIFIGVFISFWVGTFVALKMGPLWRTIHAYPFQLNALTSFKVPFQMVWPLIAALIITVGHLYGYMDSWAEVVGFNALLIMGVFYFFQGFGILSDLLNYWRIFGFFRSMVIFFTVVMGYQILAILGVLDTWVDFRRFLNNKNNEGDTL
jgi:hypothetical protein